MNKLIEKKLIERDNHLDTNLQSMFYRSGQRFEDMYNRSNKIFDKQDTETKKIGNEMVTLK